MSTEVEDMNEVAPKSDETPSDAAWDDERQAVNPVVTQYVANLSSLPSSQEEWRVLLELTKGTAAGDYLRRYVKEQAKSARRVKAHS